MTEPAPACRSSRCRHRGDCARNPSPPAAAGGEGTERPRCFEAARVGGAPSAAPFGRMAD
jgi:hypothetical protein